MLNRFRQHMSDTDEFNVPASPIGVGGLLEGLTNGYQVDELVAEIGQESQARIAILWGHLLALCSVG